MEERRSRILTAAREIIAADGYEALTMRSLAEASHVTVPTIYNLIGSKEQVLFAAVEDQNARFLASVEAATALDPVDRVLALVDATTTELLRMSRYYRTLIRLLWLSDRPTPATQAVESALGGQVARVVEALADAGDLAPYTDTRSLRVQLRSLLDASSLQWARGQIDDAAFPQVATHGCTLLLLGATRGKTRERLEELALRTRRAPRPASRAAEGGA